MPYSTRPRALTVFVVLASALALFLPSAVAGTASLVVVADGLDNPRGIALRGDGAIFVAESGRGGGRCERVPGFGRPCFGMTASVTRIAPDGSVRTVVRLPSIAGPDGFASGGASDVAFEAGDFFITMGGMAPEVARHFGPNGRLFNDLLRAKPLERIAELGRFEAKNNPAEDIIESNPYSILRVAGASVVADAAGNSLLYVPDAGGPSVVATFPTQDLEAPDGSTIAAHAVPNTVTVGPDGFWYVGQLTGFPFTLGASRVWRIDPTARDVACDAAATTGPCTLFASGLTAIIDIAFGPDDKLYVLEIAKNGLLQAEQGGDFTGALLRRDGTTFTEIASEGLIAPTGVAISAAGEIFVTNFGIFPGDGQVVEVVTAP